VDTVNKKKHMKNEKTRLKKVILWMTNGITIEGYVARHIKFPICLNYQDTVITIYDASINDESERAAISINVNSISREINNNIVRV
jgi:sRNA-binding regulator protein Hfq